MNIATRPMIAVIDGTTDRYSFLEQFPEQEEAQIILLPDARSALRLWHASNCAVWLVDGQLPDMRGSACIEMLIQLYPQARYCLIVDKYNADEERFCFRFRHARYLCRPLHTKWLNQWIRTLVSQWPGHDAPTPARPRFMRPESDGAARHEHREPPRGPP